MTSDTGATYTDLTLAIRLLRFVRPYLPHLLALLGISLLSVPLTLLGPVPLKIAVDNVIGGKPLAWGEALLPAGVTGSPGMLLTLAAVLMIVISILSRLHGVADGILRMFTGERLVLDVRTRLFAQLQRISILHHERAGTSDSAYRIQYDAQSVQSFVIDGIIPMLSSVAMLVAMFSVTIRLDPTLSLIAASTILPTFLLAFFFRERLRLQWGKVKEIESRGLSMMEDSLGAARVVRGFGQQDREQARFASVFREGLNVRLRTTLQRSGLMLLMSAGGIAAAALTLVVGVRHVLAGELSLGNLLIVIAYLGQTYAPLMAVAGGIATLQSAFAGAARVFAILDEAQEVPEKPHALPITRARGSLEFKGVSFAYAGKTPVLRDVSFTVPAGSRVGIVGPTGAGKSTLLHLIMRFHDPHAGRILMDGIDIRDFKLTAFRDQFTVVPQDPVLLARSIAENIAYGKPSATMQEIVEAATLARIHDFIMQLPAGYDTVVGARGALVSGGERQRISLARAFLKDAPFLVLDEATSAMDTSTEAEIVHSMNALRGKRTMLIVAHRLSMIEGCDPILVVDNHRVTVQQSLTLEELESMSLPAQRVAEAE